MRITGGTVRGRKLAGPKAGRATSTIRPTSDRVREALFSILHDRLQNALVLDLFAGTGVLGLEALSRGAHHAVFVDQSTESIELIRQNLLHCFPQPAATILGADLNRHSSFSRLRSCLTERTTFDLIFLDPPYEKKLAMLTLIMIEKADILAPEARVIAEERWHEQLPRVIGRLHLETSRRYGETGIWIYKYVDPLT